MKAEQAISLIVNARYSQEWAGNPQLLEARRMAVKALKRYGRHGEWKTKPGYTYTVFCSVCGSGSYEGRENFCPNCGADMRGKHE